MHTCVYCNSEFNNKCNLNKHQRTSKYCLKIQLEKNPNKIIERDTYDCEYCKRQLTSKFSLNSHLKICKVKKLQLTQQTIVEKLTVQLKDKPVITVTNNNLIMNHTTNHNYSSLLDYNDNYEKITEKFKKHYTIENLLKGDQKELADMTVQHFLSGKDQPMYYITDRSRNKFMFTDQENNEKEDPNANILRRVVYKALKPIVDKLYKDEFIKLKTDLARYLRNDINDRIELTHKELKELEESYQKTNIFKAGDDYVLQLSKCLPSSIKDRMFLDTIGLYDEDIDSTADNQIEVEKITRNICGYTAYELRDFKKIYKETGVIKCPNSFDRNDKEQLQKYVKFLQEND